MRPKKFAIAFVCVVLCCCICSLAVDRPQGLAPVEKFEDSELVFDVTCFSVISAPNGYIYTNTHNQILEYNGSVWNEIYKMKGVVSIEADSSNNIYYISKKGIGYLSPNSDGSYVNHKIDYPKSNKKSNRKGVVKIIVENENVYFFLSTGVVYWNGVESKRVKFCNKISTAFKHNNKVFFSDDSLGVHSLDKEKLVLEIRRSQLDTIIRMPLGDVIDMHKDFSFQNKEKLIYIISNGSLLHYKNNQITKLKHVYPQLDDHIRLRDGNHAFICYRKGIIILNPEGEIVQSYSTYNGLSGNYITGLCLDNDGNLWVSLLNGVNKIEFSAPYRTFNMRNGLAERRVIQTQIHKGKLYVATQNGLFIYDKPKLDADNYYNNIKEYQNSFKKIEGINSACHNLFSNGEILLVTGCRGLFQVIGDKVKEMDVFKENEIDCMWDFYQSKFDRNRFYLFTKKGLCSFYILGEQIYNEGVVKGIKGKYLYENDKGVLFDLSGDKLTSLSGVKKGRKFNINSGTQINSVDFGVIPFNIDKAVPLVSRTGYMFSLPGEVYRLSLDSGYFTKTGIFDEIIGSSKIISNILWEDDSNTMIVTALSPENTSVRKTGVIHQDEDLSYRWNKSSFADFSNKYFSTIQIDDNKVAWLCTNHGLVKYHLSDTTHLSRDFKTIISEVMISDTTAYVGNRSNYDYNHEYNFGTDLLIKFSANSHFQKNGISYQFFMEGYDEGWSAWTTDNNINYTNIKEGDYCFRIISQNQYGKIGKETSYCFSITPPWYRTWLAYSFYLIFFGVVVFLFSLFKNRKLLREKNRLESIVNARTKELKEKQVLLEQKTKELIEMDKVKSSFFANISHEFKTPLTLISAPLEKLISDSENSQNLELYSTMQRNCSKLLTHINQFLKLSKVTSGTVEINKTQGNLNRLVESVFIRFSEMAKLKDIEYKFQEEDDNLCLEIDGELLDTAITNLLSNAFKFTDNGGEITVSVSKNKRNSAIIRIKDNGIGIEDEQQKYIFNKFYQVNNTSTRKYEGTGIGLALAKEYSLMHNGNLTLNSVPGEGSTFMIEIPGVLKSNVSESKIIKPETDVNIITPETSLKNRLVVNSTNNQMVLVVEDNIDMCNYLVDVLSSEYTVVVANDGNEGVKIAIEKVPDIILSDVMMPDKDGYELTKTLKGNIITSHIPIILLTAKNSLKERIRGLEYGADDYMSKPFSQEELLLKIKNILASLSKSEGQSQGNIPKEESQTIEEIFMEKAGVTIENNIGNSDFSIEDFSNEMGMSRRHLHRKLKALTNLSPSQFIRSYRLNKAKSIILNKELSISETAYQVGFEDLSYFSKCFKEQFGQSPSEINRSSPQDANIILN